MRSATQCSLFALSALALAAFAPAVSAQQAKEVLPWQKPQAPQPDPDVKELLPWLIGEGGSKKPKSGAVWNASVAEPKGPAEPHVADPGMAPGTHIETGAIAPSGLVLKSKVPGANPVVNTAAGEGAGRIQRSVPLPGDRPVEQSEASEISAEQSGQTQTQQPADDAAPVVPADAAAVPADQLAAPAGEPPAASEATAAAEGATPVAVPPAATQPDTSNSALAAPPVEHLPAPASPVRAAFPRAKAVTAAPKAVGLAAPKGDLAAPAAGHEAVHEQTAQAPVANEAPVDGATPAAAPPEAAQPVEGVPALPVAEEAPPVPDPLPDAVVTPVPQADAVKATDVAAPASKAEKAEEAGLPRVKPPLPKSLAENANVAQQYCFNIADAAKDARYAWQKKTLADIEVELNKRIALLDARTAEYQKWLARRDEFIRNAEENVVKIMSGMRPDAAAVQLTLMNEEAAAAVIAKLSARNSSAILNEMDPAKAAKLTMIITGATKLKRKKELQQNMTPGSGEGAKPVPPAGARADAAQPQGGRS